LSERSSNSPKQRVARAAAILLYTSQEKEYKQAKLRASRTLGIRVLPSNALVANELDNVADEMEGAVRKEILLQMRREALEIMKALENYHPKLIGSVWRGTARRDSDIDIVAFASDLTTVLAQLQRKNFKVAKTEWRSAPKLSRREKSFHISLLLSSGNQAEVVVRDLERRNEKEKCEIYGDIVTGLSCRQLEKVLIEDPFKKIVP